MTDPTDTMRTMVKTAITLGNLPGVDKEDTINEGADRMRRTVAENLSDLFDDVGEVELEEAIKDAEDEVIRSDDLDTDGVPDGVVRMVCQEMLVEMLMEDDQ